MGCFAGRTGVAHTRWMQVNDQPANSFPAVQRLFDANLSNPPDPVLISRM